MKSTVQANNMIYIYTYIIYYIIDYKSIFVLNKMMQFHY